MSIVLRVAFPFPILSRYLKPRYRLHEPTASTPGRVPSPVKVRFSGVPDMSATNHSPIWTCADVTCTCSRPLTCGRRPEMTRTVVSRAAQILKMAGWWLLGRDTEVTVR